MATTARERLAHLLRDSEQAVSFSAQLTAPPHVLQLEVSGVGRPGDVTPGSYDAAIDATNDPSVPAEALHAVRPGGRLVCIGIAGEPSRIDTRDLVFGDITVVGLLSGSPGLRAAIDSYASGAVDPTPLVAATVGLAGVADALAGRRPAGARPGPKVQVDPRL